MIHAQARPSRRGYTLTVVLLMLILLFGLWTFVIRSTSSLLRIETTRSLRQSRDQGVMNALAQAVRLLQYGYPSDSQNPSSLIFTYYVTTMIPISGASPITSADTKEASYKVVYTWVDQANQIWQIRVTSADSVDSTKMLPTVVTPSIAWPAGAGQS